MYEIDSHSKEFDKDFKRLARYDRVLARDCELVTANNALMVGNDEEGVHHRCQKRRYRRRVLLYGDFAVLRSGSIRERSAFVLRNGLRRPARFRVEFLIEAVDRHRRPDIHRICLSVDCLPMIVFGHRPGMRGAMRYDG